MINNNKILKKVSNCEGCIIKPCQVGCPLHNDITDMIKLIKQQKYEEAYYLLSETTVLPSICGRVCPYEKQCQGMCAKGVSFEPVDIGALESFIGDLAIQKEWKYEYNTKLINKKVAVIGSGPSSLTCAAFLRRKGIDVTIYEKRNYLGGLLMYGIPDFRLDKEIVQESINKIIDLGINVKYNTELGKEITLDELRKEYDAVYIGIGTSESFYPNESFKSIDGVYGCEELLEDSIDFDYTNKRVIVYGGGNTAIDLARIIKRENASNVTIMYRKEKKYMKANSNEIINAEKEGINFLFESEIDNIENKNGLLKVVSKNKKYEVDLVAIATGFISDINLLKKLKLELDNKNNIKVNINGQTSIENVFAGGDIASNKKTVAFASYSGRVCANSIYDYLTKK